MGIDIERLEFPRDWIELGMMASKVVVDGSATYTAIAEPGSAEASEVWQAKRAITVGSNVTITWADGDAFFDNAADDLGSLSYS